MTNVIDVLLADIQKLAENVVDEKTLKIIGEELANDIRTRTKFSNVVKKFGASPTRMPFLQPSTILQRQKKRLAPDTSAKTSNLTETGEMLNSIRYKTSKNAVSLYLAGDRNRKIAGYHMAGTRRMVARPFFNLDKFNVSRAELLILSAFDDFILKRWRNR